MEGGVERMVDDEGKGETVGDPPLVVARAGELLTMKDSLETRNSSPSANLESVEKVRS